jgi:hypothetical protein
MHNAALITCVQCVNFTGKLWGITRGSMSPISAKDTAHAAKPWVQVKFMGKVIPGFHPSFSP